MLDDLNLLAHKDSDNMLAVIAAMPEQLKWQPAAIPEVAVKQVVFAGMGGSALAAQVVKNWLAPQLQVPFEIVRGYSLPAYVNSETLVVVDSYSGNTEEELAILESAEQAKAQLVIIASGGQLEQHQHRHPHAFIELPDGYQPRLAVWFGIKAIASLMDNVGLTQSAAHEVENCYQFLSSAVLDWLPQVETSNNFAKQLAEQLMGKLVVIYSGPTLSSAAYKWKININENAKTLSAWNELPEMNHNELLGWVRQPVEKPFAVLELQSELDNARIQKRWEATNRLLSGQMPKPIEISAKGSNQLEQLLWAILLGDFVSCYLAILHGVNPTSVDLIEKLKKALQ